LKVQRKGKDRKKGEVENGPRFTDITRTKRSNKTRATFSKGIRTKMASSNANELGGGGCGKMKTVKFWQPREGKLGKKKRGKMVRTWGNNQCFL